MNRWGQRGRLWSKMSHPARLPCLSCRNALQLQHGGRRWFRSSFSHSGSPRETFLEIRQEKHMAGRAVSERRSTCHFTPPLPARRRAARKARVLDDPSRASRSRRRRRCSGVVTHSGTAPGCVACLVDVTGSGFALGPCSHCAGTVAGFGLDSRQGLAIYQTVDILPVTEHRRFSGPRQAQPRLANSGKRRLGK